MQKQIMMFLVKFNKLKNEVNNAPKKLEWLFKEREDVQLLRDELQNTCQDIKKVNRNTRA